MPIIIYIKAMTVTPVVAGRKKFPKRSIVQVQLCPHRIEKILILQINILILLVSPVMGRSKDCLLRS